MSREKWNGWANYYPPSVPKPVKDGIKTESSRGRIGSKWWSHKWLASMEAVGGASRLLRGRSYARNGQVIGIEIAPGVVTAKVQGSRARPYQVSIEVTVFSDEVWNNALRLMSERPVFIAKLLNGEMPDDIEEAFAESALTLLPKSKNDLVTECSCPDWANPCKHIAAVFYLLAEEFDRDPFMIFTLRGRTRDEVIAALREADPSEQEAMDEADDPWTRTVPLSAAGFFADRSADARHLPPIEPPVVEAPILRRLGDIPLSQPVRVEGALSPLYHDVTDWSVDMASGEG